MFMEPLVFYSKESSLKLQPILIDEEDEDDVHSTTTRVTSPCKAVATATTKRVTFHSQGRMRLVKSLKGLSAKHKAKIWMTREDYHRTQSEAKADFQLINTQNTFQRKGIHPPPPRILGIGTVQRYEQRRQAQTASTKAVLEEHASQQRDGYTCDNMIAMVYQEHSEKAHQRAQWEGVLTMLESKAWSQQEQRSSIMMQETTTATATISL